MLLQRPCLISPCCPEADISCRMNSLELKTSSVFGQTPNMRSGVTLWPGGGDGASDQEAAAQLSTANAVSVHRPESTAARQDFR